jgi:outer membrane protein assembly factor BamD
MRWHSIVAVAGVAAALAAGCSAKRPVAPADKLWAEANQAYSDEAWEYAVDRYKALLEQHPFDENAEEAELRIAQAYYASERYPEALAAFGDFERMHPTSPNLALVGYHMGLAYLGQASTSDRDQQQITNALTYFRNVIDRFPTSPYAERSRLRVRECREALASHEHDVATYYLRHQNLRGAEARLRALLTQYPETEAAATALYTFAETYAAREEHEGATLALATIVRHHPDGPVAAEARERLGRSAATDGVDPLPVFLAHLDRMQARDDRRQVPATVSAYPNLPPGTPAGGGY